MARRLEGACDAGGGTRTLKGLLPPDFESGASASSATPASAKTFNLPHGSSPPHTRRLTDYEVERHSLMSSDVILFRSNTRR